MQFYVQKSIQLFNVGTNQIQHKKHKYVTFSKNYFRFILASQA